MTTPRHQPRGTHSETETGLFAVLLGAAAGLAWRAVRTSPGLLLILCGAALAGLHHPCIGALNALLGAFLYRTQCYRTPYTRCVRCRGIGHLKPRRLARVARRCRRCHGKGVRMRWGRRAMNAWRRATYTPAVEPDPAADAIRATPAGPVVYADALRAVHDPQPTRAAWPTRPASGPTGEQGGGGRR